MKLSSVALATFLTTISAQALPPFLGSPVEGILALEASLSAETCSDTVDSCQVPITLEAHVPSGDTSGSSALFAVARATVCNLSGKALTLELPNLSGGTPRFSYKLCDAAGNVFWTSTVPAGPRVLTQATLKKQEVWTDSVLIPLVSQRGYLLAGKYTLSVSIEGAPQFQASCSVTAAP